MDAGGWALLGAVVLLALVVGLLAGVVLSQRRRLTELGGQVTLQAQPHQSAAPTVAPVQEAEFVITRVGGTDTEAPAVVENRVVLSATLGEPLVKVVALAHGVRRALSPESRNRILFEMRREVRRTRKERRREMRQAWRDVKQRDAA